ncbi:MAG TPA: sensor histidine kinase [Streptosporangiaceae bacterium]|nr:sensor histidine kinase [Streptosporangiaceae bacterium]
MTSEPAVSGRYRISRVILRAPVAGSSWMATLQVMTGAAVAIITVSVMIALAAVAAVVGLTVVLAAVPFVAMLACSDVFAAWQRSRIAAFTGVMIPITTVLPRNSDATLLSDLLRAARQLSTWRHIAYHLFVGPVLAAIGATVVACAWSGALLFTARPLLVLLLPGITGASAPKDAAVTGAGLLLIFVAPWVARGVALLDTATATVMLGPTRADEVRRLAESRAAAVSAADAERRRIERDLHDGTQQRLVSMAMRLGLALATMDDLPDDARKVIQRAHDDAKDALKELRDLVQGLHPAILADRGLDAALSGIAARAPLPVTLSVDLVPGGRVPVATEAVAFFIVSETLTNTAKHARATRASVSVTQRRHGLTIKIEDDGGGGADPARGSGLRGLAQRAASVDGTLHIHSPEGGPTVITAELPCGS